MADTTLSAQPSTTTRARRSPTSTRSSASTTTKCSAMTTLPWSERMRPTGDDALGPEAATRDAVFATAWRPHLRREVCTDSLRASVCRRRCDMAIPAEREPLELRSPRRWTATPSCRSLARRRRLQANHAKRTTTDHPAREDAAPMFWQADTGSMLVIRVPPWDSQAMGAHVAAPPGSISTSTRSRHAAADRMRSRTCRTTFLEGG